MGMSSFQIFCGPHLKTLLQLLLLLPDMVGFISVPLHNPHHKLVLYIWADRSCSYGGEGGRGGYID